MKERSKKPSTPDQDQQPQEQEGWSNGDIRPSEDEQVPTKLPMQNYGLPKGLKPPSRASIRGN